MPYANQIQRILDSTHHDPFEVLGYHEFDNKTSSIRAFFPNAATIDVIFLNNNEVFRVINTAPHTSHVCSIKKLGLSVAE